MIKKEKKNAKGRKTDKKEMVVREREMMFLLSIEN